jgi:hypothetical protein
MGHIPSPEDRPDPSERNTALRARVPDHVATGNISTGVIVVTGGTEFVLDFVRNLPRPSLVVARVILPHTVMPQFVDALNNNIGIYKQRFGDLEMIPNHAKPSLPPEATSQAIVSAQMGSPSTEPTRRDPDTERLDADSINSSDGDSDAPREGSRSSGSAGSGQPVGSGNTGPTRHTSPHEIYDDLKLKDELLSGSYANAVMIGHGPHEFCFDFITNFYPQSAVSCRVFMAAGHILRVYDSLKASWEQLKPRLGGPPAF